MGEDVPSPNTSEIVVFVDLFTQGFNVLLHWFVQDLLLYFDTQVHHLTPNGIMLLAIFISFSEGYTWI